MKLANLINLRNYSNLETRTVTVLPGARLTVTAIITITVNTQRGNVPEDLGTSSQL